MLKGAAIVGMMEVFLECTVSGTNKATLPVQGRPMLSNFQASTSLKLEEGNKCYLRSIRMKNRDKVFLSSDDE